MQARGRTAGTGRLGEPGAEGVGGAAAVITAGMRLHGAEWDLKSLREAARRQGLAAWPGRRQLQGAEDRGGCCCVRGGQQALPAMRGRFPRTAEPTGNSRERVDTSDIQLMVRLSNIFAIFQFLLFSLKLNAEGANGVGGFGRLVGVVGPIYGVHRVGCRGQRPSWPQAR
jgi:hypothetical protein